VKCPRCGRDSTDGAAICRRCGAPLAIPEDPAPGSLDTPLDLDRRARNTLPGPPLRPTPRRVPAAPSASTAPPVRPPVRPPPRPQAARPPPAPPAEPPDFFEPPVTPTPKPLAPVVRDPSPPADVTNPDLGGLPRQEHPPGYGDGDGYVFADLPEDDAEFAEPPMTSEADDAFAALTERVRGGTPAPVLPPPAPIQPHWPVGPPQPLPGERPALELFDPTPAPKPPPEAAPPAPRPPPPPKPPPAPPPRPPSSPAVRPAAPPPPAAKPPVPPPPPPAPPPASALPKTPPRPRPAPRPPPDLELPEAEVTSIEVHVTLPPPWRRAAAWAVDAVPFAVLVAAVAAGVSAQGGGKGGLAALAALAVTQRAVGLSLLAFLALLLFTYGTLAHALAGATLGKRLLGLKLVASDGGRPSLTRCAVRSALSLVSLALLGLGFLLALFTRTGRSLHDLVARTWVVEAP
jgi:uncharacterized RDD family membrane protein YckC